MNLPKACPHMKGRERLCRKKDKEGKERSKKGRKEEVKEKNAGKKEKKPGTDPAIDIEVKKEDRKLFVFLVLSLTFFLSFFVITILLGLR